jgi:hypothetical protein
MCFAGKCCPAMVTSRAAKFLSRWSKPLRPVPNSALISVQRMNGQPGRGLFSLIEMNL